MPSSFFLRMIIVRVMKNQGIPSKFNMLLLDILAGKPFMKYHSKPEFCYWGTIASYMRYVYWLRIATSGSRRLSIRRGFYNQLDILMKCALQCVAHQGLNHLVVLCNQYN